MRRGSAVGNDRDDDADGDHGRGDRAADVEPRGNEGPSRGFASAEVRLNAPAVTNAHGPLLSRTHDAPRQSPIRAEADTPTTRTEAPPRSEPGSGRRRSPRRTGPTARSSRSRERGAH